MLVLSPEVLRRLTPSCPPLSERLLTLVTLGGLALLLRLAFDLDAVHTVGMLAALCVLAVVTTTASSVTKNVFTVLRNVIALAGNSPATQIAGAVR
jgi:hypothetical protein